MKKLHPRTDLWSVYAERGAEERTRVRLEYGRIGVDAVHRAAEFQAQYGGPKGAEYTVGSMSS